MTEPELPSLEARFFGAPGVWWLEHGDGVWRAWRQDGMFTGVWEEPEDRFREYTITAEVDGRLPWRHALEAIAAVLWAPVDNPRPYENEQRSSERRRFPDSLTEEAWLEHKTFPIFPHLRVANDVTGLRAFIFCDRPNLDALDAIETLAYLAIEGSDGAEQVLQECLEHPHYRVRCESVEALAFVRWRKSGRGRGYKTLDQALWVPRMPVNYNPPRIEPGLRFTDVATRALADDNPSVRCVGLRYLRLSDPAGVVDNTSLRAAATSDPSPLVRRYALQTLSRVRDAEILQIAAALLHDPDHTIRGDAIARLEFLAEPAALAALLEALPQAHPDNHANFWLALHGYNQRAKFGRRGLVSDRTKVEATLKTLLREPGWRTSLYLPVLLEDVHTPGAEESLAQLQADPAADVQEMLVRWRKWKEQMERDLEEADDGGSEDDEDTTYA